MSDYFCNIPCGTAIPYGNPHAVSVSLPTINDVVGYEEGNTEVINAMQSGYPRFFNNKLVQQLVDFVCQKNNIDTGKIILPIVSIHAKNVLEYLVNDTLEFIEEDGNVFLLFDENDTRIKLCKDYIRNVGLLISSRQAEASLFKLKVISTIFQEKTVEGNLAETTIKTVLAKAYSAEDTENVLLANSGMNALFSSYEVVKNARNAESRNTVVQLGWLYVDTMEIIERRSEKSHIQINYNDKNQLEDWLSNNHNQVASIFTEITTNPLLQCVDLPWLYEICNQYTIVLITDTTIATPYNVEVLQYCDIAVESLTKFACGNADVLMGAVVLNPKSKWTAQLKEKFTDFIIPPFKGEISRLGYQIKGYETRVKKSSQNAKLLYDYLKTKSFIKEIYTTNQEFTNDAFAKIKKPDGQFPGLISIVFDKELGHYYDQLELAKGPSLGTEFTIAMPYVYLAHYDCLKTDEGKAKLKKLGLHPELLRISVGIEPAELIIAAFEKLEKGIEKSIGIAINHSDSFIC
ncbi:MAG: PLP-dependent transferase [Bacteroidota bacterium]